MSGEGWQAFDRNKFLLELVEALVAGRKLDKIEVLTTISRHDEELQPELSAWAAMFELAQELGERVGRLEANRGDVQEWIAGATREIEGLHTLINRLQDRPYSLDVSVMGEAEEVRPEPIETPVEVLEERMREAFERGLIEGRKFPGPLLDRELGKLVERLWQEWREIAPAEQSLVSSLRGRIATIEAELELGLKQYDARTDELERERNTKRRKVKYLEAELDRAWSWARRYRVDLLLAGVDPDSGVELADDAWQRPDGHPKGHAACKGKA